MSTNLEWITEGLTSLKENGLYNSIRTINSAQGAWLQVNGKKVLNFCSNNYLGLANHPRLVSAAKKAIDEYGVGPGAVRIISGTNDLHLQLEEKIAKFKGVEAAITFQSGFTANLGTIAALVGKDDVIFSDELNHASIIDGARLSKAKIIPYKHSDMEDLKAKIAEHRTQYTHALLVTDGVFSMDGDLAFLDKIYEITCQHDIILMVDDAHGEGVVGNSGRGIVDHYGLHGKVDIEIGTFSKAFGVMGGVVAGKQEIIDWLRQRGRPFMFSSASTPADVAACIEAIAILEESSELVDKLWDNGKYFKAGMQELGFDTGDSHTPITPVMLYDAKVARDFSNQLFEEGIYATSLSYPVVPQGKARLRVMISAAHSKEDLDFALEAFKKVGIKTGILSK